MADIDFSDALFVLGCGCIFDGCSGAAGVDRFMAGQAVTMECFVHRRRTLIKQIVTVNG